MTVKWQTKMKRQTSLRNQTSEEMLTISPKDKSYERRWDKLKTTKQKNRSHNRNQPISEEIAVWQIGTWAMTALLRTKNAEIATEPDITPEYVGTNE